MFLLSFRILSAVIRQRRVVVENKHGEKLVGILHETGSKELVVVCHGIHSSKVVIGYDKQTMSWSIV